MSDTVLYNNDIPEGRVWVPYHIDMDRPQWDWGAESTNDLLILTEPLSDDDDACYSAWITRDGEITLYLDDLPFNEDVTGENLWIDDIDRMIARLQELRARAYAWFGQEWSG